ncbi:lamin tail domain-containing protein [Aureispira anguillae]|uniref:Lamin tail domain-containing protein n=1 Tax=Aureispira anguillae TaxID=2864201 RepID=A0A915YC08_9BACT|nr:lamin tail domain-containing protein [Aureispira anguillae]BDS10243.1 lamin tail domain-containing protein [Aureispira anguillae]
MKKLFATLSAICMVNFAAQSQVVINEVLYNIPGSGENEEFIELHNMGAAAVNLQNYTFTQGVTHTFNSGTIPAGGYFVIASDSAAFHASFGVAPDAVWTSGGLSNGGEDITIYDGAGTLIDSVDYETSAPWPADAAGQGRSLQLCDPVTDNNLGTNWGTSNIANGVNGTTGTDSLYATPGLVNACVIVVPPPPPSYPVYTFDQINNVDTNGTADSVNVTCELRGIAHCIDLRGGTGIDFNFANSNNSAGVRVFSFVDVDNYTVTSGDSLHIWGEVVQFNGLLQFAPDSIVVISQGNPTATPMLVTQLSETTENRLVMFANMHLVDTAEWTGSGSGFNVRMTDGGADTIVVRIDNDVDLYSQTAPLGTFSISGWGGQFDSSIPRNEGYQLMPCNMMMITGTHQVENNSGLVRIYPNPASTLLNVQSDVEIQTIAVYNTLGQAVVNLNNVNTTTTQVATSDLENGVYIISIVTNEKTMTQQFQVVK